jgi:hypothetical protein
MHCALMIRRARSSNLMFQTDAADRWWVISLFLPRPKTATSMLRDIPAFQCRAMQGVNNASCHSRVVSGSTISNSNFSLLLHNQRSCAVSNPGVIGHVLDNVFLTVSLIVWREF